MIDKKGFRLNVGIILVNNDKQVFWGKRVGQDAWQFPQGGLNNYETVEEAMYRELREEIGLVADDIRLLGVTRRWLYYHLPYHLRRHHQLPYCVGQKQKWFLLQLVAPEDHIRFDHTDSPEFDHWKWVDYWYPVDHVIDFKRDVYRAALEEFEKYL